MKKSNIKTFVSRHRWRFAYQRVGYGLELSFKRFNLDPKETEERHDLMFSTYELGKLSLDEYLRFTVFYQPRSFTRGCVVAFMYEQSQPLDGALDFFRELKKQNQLKVVALSNEARRFHSILD